MGMVSTLPERYLKDQASRSGIRAQQQRDLRSPARKGLVFQAGFRVTQVGIKKLDLRVRVCQAELCNYVCAGSLPNSVENVERLTVTSETFPLEIMKEDVLVLKVCSGRGLTQGQLRDGVKTASFLIPSEF